MKCIDVKMITRDKMPLRPKKKKDKMPQITLNMKQIVSSFFKGFDQSFSFLFLKVKLNE